VTVGRVWRINFIVDQPQRGATSSHNKRNGSTHARTPTILADRSREQKRDEESGSEEGFVMIVRAVVLAAEAEADQWDHLSKWSRSSIVVVVVVRSIVV